MRIAVIGAMEMEIALLKEAMTFQKTKEIAGLTFLEGTLEGHEIVLVRSGVGKVNAALCTQILADHFRPDAIINTGAAGSLREENRIGDLVVSTDVVHHDVDATLFGYQKGEVPQLGQLSFPADEKLRAAAVRAARAVAPDIAVREGRVASGDRFIAERALKEEIAETFGALCVEMEGAAIAQVAWLNRIPFVILRAISDQADESVHVSYDEFEIKAAHDCAAITREVFLHL